MASEKRIHDVSENEKTNQAKEIEPDGNQSPALKQKEDESEAQKDETDQSEPDKECIDQSEAVKSRPRRRSICVSSLFSMNSAIKGGCFEFFCT